MLGTFTSTFRGHGTHSNGGCPQLGPPILSFHRGEIGDRVKGCKCIRSRQTSNQVTGLGYGLKWFSTQLFQLLAATRMSSTIEASEIIRDEDYYLQNAIFQVSGRT